jgi:hypothetical protein
MLADEGCDVMLDGRDASQGLGSDHHYHQYRRAAANFITGATSRGDCGKRRV